MAESSDRAIELAFPQAVDAMSAACGVGPSARSAFIARVRHLQRLGLPPRGVAPVHARLGYGLAEMAAVATGFRLMAAFLLPTLAARYVLERWTEITPALLAGAAGDTPAGSPAQRPAAETPILVLEGAALAELGRKAAHEGRYDGALGAVTRHGTGGVEAIMKAAGGAGVVIDARGFMPALMAAIRSDPTIDEGSIAHELDRLRLSRSVPAL